MDVDLVCLKTLIINRLVGSALVQMAVLEPPVDNSGKVQKVIVDFFGDKDSGYHCRD